MNITLGGGGRIDRVLEDAEGLLISYRDNYRDDGGLHYLDYLPVSDPDTVVPDDLAVTLLINSRADATAFRSAQDRGRELPLASLGKTALENTTDQQRQAVADVVGQMATWRGFAASLATKTLHKKRPALIPILDNHAIFGAYMNPSWPTERSGDVSVKDVRRIREALERIYVDLTRPENDEVWRLLQGLQLSRSRIELFDMVWWTHFRRREPVAPARPLGRAHT